MISDITREHIKEIKKLSFVTSAKISGDELKVNTKPVVMVVEKFRKDDSSEDFGTHYFYYGKLNITLHDGSDCCSDIVKSEGTLQHGVSDGGTCYGSDCDNEIYKLKQKGDYAGVLKMIWFWAHTDVPHASYKHAEYSFILFQYGLPIWDAKGKRVQPNDPKRLKSRAQYQELLERYHRPCYKSNLKKYKDTKLEDVYEI